jgi:hypothetical protein
MKRVIIESPYAGDVEANVAYLKACIADCLRRGEAPFASHRMYPGVLDDDDPAERQLGIRAGFAWISIADATVVYTDRGISKGMLAGIAEAKACARPIFYRQLNGLPTFRARDV